jgi:hypothetical protein
VASCLEAARVEVLRRLSERNLPGSIEVQRVVVKDNVDRTGWSTEWETVRVSSLSASEIQFQLRDDSVPFMLIGLRDQLQPLADFLDKYSDLGQKRPQGIFPNATGPDAVLARYLVPLALTYVSGLTDVARRSTQAIERINDELAQLCDAPAITHRRQLALEGLRISRRLGPYRDVTLRPLTGVERGQAQQDELTAMSQPRLPTSDYVVPRQFGMFSPRTLLEIATTRRRDKLADESRLPNRLALAFYLMDYEIAGPGILIGFDEPRWASTGFTHSPFPVTERTVSEKALTPTTFKSIVDLAYRIPDFGGEEGSGKEIALFRTLRGCGARDSGFLDFAIALEAALLGGATTELAYRFSLYGALFLQDDRDTDEAFAKLKNIYDVRSKLVHGSRIRREARTAAEQDARELTRAVVKKSVEQGWPDAKKLDGFALAQG